VTEPGRAGSRLLRATALSAVTVTLALAAHRLSGGTTPTGTTVVQATVVLALVLGVLTGPRRSTTALVTTLAGAQLLLHQWFTLATPGECAGHLATQYVPGAQLLPQSWLSWGVAQTARACATTGDTGATVIALAVAFHALAAIVTGVLLTRGQALLTAAVALVVPALPGRPPVQGRLTACIPHVAWVGGRRVLDRHVLRRGPPAQAGVA
jgi:hypothetical protein